MILAEVLPMEYQKVQKNVAMSPWDTQSQSLKNFANYK